MFLTGDGQADTLGLKWYAKSLFDVNGKHLFRNRLLKYKQWAVQGLIQKSLKKWTFDNIF